VVRVPLKATTAAGHGAWWATGDVSIGFLCVDVAPTSDMIGLRETVSDVSRITHSLLCHVAGAGRKGGTCVENGLRADAESFAACEAFAGV
jgi:hypothetical protein